MPPAQTESHLWVRDLERDRMGDSYSLSLIPLLSAIPVD